MERNQIFSDDEGEEVAIMLKVGAARANMNPPLTIEQGVWGAKTHVTPTHIESDFWTTALVLGDGTSMAVLLDLDLCTITNERADAIRTKVAAALKLEKQQVRVSVTHTHAGPVLRTDAYTANREAEEHYIQLIIEQSVSAALLAARRQVPVAVHSEYGLCGMGKNRRQQMADGSIITGFNPTGATDPTVSVIRFDDESGKLVASIVHYAAHPTTLGYTNEAASPDYPGVTKRFVEQTVGGICLFLQAAAGDIGPGPGGFLSNMDVVQDIGTILGCAASQTLIEAKNKQFDYEFSKIVPSGADLGIWSRVRKPLAPLQLQVLSQMVSLQLRQQRPPEEVQKMSDDLFARLNHLKETDAPEGQIHEVNYQLRRNNMALRRSKLFYGRKEAEMEIHFIQFGDTVLIGIPLEPFSEIGKQIRERSPFAYTLFSGYSNGANAYLPTAEAFTQGGYEVEQAAFVPEAADLLVEQIIGALKQMAD